MSSTNQNLKRCTIEKEIDDPLPFELSEMEEWYACWCQEMEVQLQLDVRLVDKESSASLNQAFRKKKGPTDVLTFVDEDSADICLCVPFIQEDALSLGRDFKHHFAHIFLHGFLHALGYQHHQESAQKEMRALENKLLNSIGFSHVWSVL